MTTVLYIPFLNHRSCQQWILRCTQTRSTNIEDITTSKRVFLGRCYSHNEKEQEEKTTAALRRRSERVVRELHLHLQELWAWVKWMMMRRYIPLIFTVECSTDPRVQRYKQKILQSSPQPPNPKQQNCRDSHISSYEPRFSSCTDEKLVEDS